jgi:DNA-directed RNA polymerase specialized sigma24 family protein
MPPSNPEGAGRHISQIETIWPVLYQAHGGPAPEATAAQQAVLQRYRPAVFRYLLVCLGSADAAEELFQEFALRFVRGDFRNANPEKGRFRDLLKTALYHLVADYHKLRRRGPPRLSPNAPEPAGPAPPDPDRQFLEAWRADLLNRAWDALAGEERRTGRPLHTVLHLRAASPELRSAQMAEQLAPCLGKGVTADWVRKWLHAARAKFADLLLGEVAASLRDPTPDALAQELIDLELFEYCRPALERWRQGEGGPPA